MCRGFSTLLWTCGEAVSHCRTVANTSQKHKTGTRGVQGVAMIQTITLFQIKLYIYIYICTFILVFFLFYFIYVGALPAFMSVYYTHAWCLTRSEEC